MNVQAGQSRAFLYTEAQTMTSSIADSIRRGLAEAVAYAEGTADENLYKVHNPVSQKRDMGYPGWLSAT